MNLHTAGATTIGPRDPHLLGPPGEEMDTGLETELQSASIDVTDDVLALLAPRDHLGPPMLEIGVTGAPVLDRVAFMMERQICQSLGVQFVTCPRFRC